MTSTQIVNVHGSGADAATWVASVKFSQAPSQQSMTSLLVYMTEKQYSYGSFSLDPCLYLIVIHCVRKATNGSCKTMLNRLFKNARIEAEVGQLAALNQYHLELFGLQHIPTSTEPEPEAPPDLAEEEQEELAELYDKARCKKDLDDISTAYFAKRDP